MRWLIFKVVFKDPSYNFLKAYYRLFYHTYMHWQQRFNKTTMFCFWHDYFSWNDISGNRVYITSASVCVSALCVSVCVCIHIITHIQGGGFSWQRVSQPSFWPRQGWRALRKHTDESVWTAAQRRAALCWPRPRCSPISLSLPARQRPSKTDSDSISTATMKLRRLTSDA